MQKVILNQLLTVKYSSINNFYSPTAKLTEGALQQAMRDFKALEEQGLIKKIPLDRKTRQKRQKQFYQVTKKGANRIDRGDEYTRNFEYQSNESSDHRSMKIDIALSFLRLYPDYHKNLYYRHRVDGKTPDIFIIMEKVHYEIPQQTIVGEVDVKGRYTFLVEIERKRGAGKAIGSIKKWEGVKFSKFGLPKNTKVLVVYVPIRFNVFLRPQDYKDSQVHKIQCETSLQQLIARAKGLSDRFRFLNFFDFYRLDEATWYTPKGERCKLINQ